MDAIESNPEDMRSRPKAKEAEYQNLRTEVRELGRPSGSIPADGVDRDDEPAAGLAAEEYRRYGRQMILPEIGMPNQLKLKNASVLIVGLGGLGCPAAAYLAGAGVGTLGFVDGDVVELSNLHRQILHSTHKVDWLKVDSAAEYVQQLNPNVRCKRYRTHLEPRSALDIFAEYDLVLDCTDHPSSRYLVSDAAVCSGIPLVSAAALRTDGQLFVLNMPPLRPGAASVISCGEGGILGPVVGVMGVLMATEAIKIISSARFPFDKTGAQEPAGSATEPPRLNMLIYSAFSSTPFRSIKIKDTLHSNSLDYAAFCGINEPLNILKPHERLTPAELKALIDKGPGKSCPLIIDVRDATQFGICHLPNSVNQSITDLEANEFSLGKTDTRNGFHPMVFVCRFGNDSQVAVKGIRENETVPPEQHLFDLQGGLQAWRQQIDPEFPDY